MIRVCAARLQAWRNAFKEVKKLVSEEIISILQEEIESYDTRAQRSETGVVLEFV